MNYQVIEDFLDTGFKLREHLSSYLNVDMKEIDSLISTGTKNMASLHPGALREDTVRDFYAEKVGNAHLFDLASWHLGSSDYIADTIRLEKMFACGRVLDFGGGIGTHSIAAAALSKVDHVFFVDLNPFNRDFVRERAKKLGISELISVHKDLGSVAEVEFDTVICFDVLEHLSNPSQQLLDFKKRMSKNAVALMNWYFYKGSKGEFPFHFDDKDLVESFFQTLQKNFIEIFHPLLITARSYKPMV